MCDEWTAEDNRRLLASPSRRGFGAMAGAAGVLALLPSPANALAVKGRRVSIDRGEQSADGYFVAPAGKHPAVLMWPDIMGLRPAFEQMARRLAESGYAVLVVNQFYRSTKAPFLAAGESFDQPEVRARIAPWREKLTPIEVMRDARVFSSWLDRRPEVDRARGIGTVGYCMGGPFAFRTAAELPDRKVAVASFHGAALVTADPDSPHRLGPKMNPKAGLLVAIAANDDARAPGDKDALKAAFAAAKRPAEIEVYAGAMHGWCPPDSKVYNMAQAERGWARMLALFARTI